MGANTVQVNQNFFCCCFCNNKCIVVCFEKDVMLLASQAWDKEKKSDSPTGIDAMIFHTQV